MMFKTLVSAFNHGSHIVAGGVAGKLARKRPTEASLITGTFLAYQFGEFWRKGIKLNQTDRIALDVKMFGIGLAAGIIAEEVLNWGDED